MALAGKLVITACLFIFLLSVICQDLGKLKNRLSDNFLISHIRIEREQVKNKARIMTLNQLMPMFDPLLTFLKDPHYFDHGRNTKEFIDYYKKVVEYMPRNADAYGMLGFFYYYCGNYEKAVASYQKAIELNGYFFWFYYDLGVICFKNSRYAEAIKFFKKALEQRPEIALKIISSSPIYTSIIKGSSHFDYPMDAALKAAYMNSYKLLALSAERLKGNSSVSFPELDEIYVRFF